MDGKKEKVMGNARKKEEADKAAEAAATEGAQEVNTNNEEMIDVNGNPNTGTQGGTVGSKRKLNQPSPAVNAQASTDANT